MAESESLWAKGDQEPTINQQMKDMRDKLDLLNRQANTIINQNYNGINTKFNAVVTAAIEKAIVYFTENYDVLGMTDPSKPVHLFEDMVEGYTVQSDFVLNCEGPVRGDSPTSNYRLMLTVFGFTDRSLGEYNPPSAFSALKTHQGLGSYYYDHFCNVARIGIRL